MCGRSGMPARPPSSTPPSPTLPLSLRVPPLSRPDNFNTPTENNGTARDANKGKDGGGGGGGSELLLIFSPPPLLPITPFLPPPFVPTFFTPVTRFSPRKRCVTHKHNTHKHTHTTHKPTKLRAGGVTIVKSPVAARGLLRRPTHPPLTPHHPSHPPSLSHPHSYNCL